MVIPVFRLLTVRLLHQLVLFARKLWSMQMALYKLWEELARMELFKQVYCMPRFIEE